MPADDAAALAADLRRRVRGEVRSDPAARALYATDASNYRRLPIAVVHPRDIDDVESAVAVCREHGAPVLPRGAGTSLAGQACNAAVILDTSRHLRSVLDVDPVARRARVQPGVVLDDLRRRAAAHGLTFGPDPATHAWCTLGGMIGNDACGVRSVAWGTTADNVETLEVLTSDGIRMSAGPLSDGEVARAIAAGGRAGEIVARLRELRDRTADLVRARYPRIPRRVSGYNLDRLLPEHGFDLARALVGSEGTCAIALEATVRLVPLPPARALLVLGFGDVASAADRVPEIVAEGPLGLEGVDDLLVRGARARGTGAAAALLPEGRAWLLVEVAGETETDAAARARRLGGRLAAPARVCDAVEAAAVWRMREAALASTAVMADGRLAWPGWEDAAVAPERLGAYLREFRDLCARAGFAPSLYGHFGDGCVHCRIPFDFAREAGVAAFRAFLDDAADLVVAHGGSLSGEHGDGTARAALLPKMFGEELVAAFREFKAIWDPECRMNPGAVVDPSPPTADLRPGATLADPPPRLAFPEDAGSLARAALRCVGVGACVRTDAGTMCPSYMATRDETHSTRGRARLLYEMLRGDAIAGGWRSEEVKGALDLCLACKACKSECPAGVDMAAYKAEFLARYYRGRRRPAHMLAFALAPRWLRAASVVPRLANAILRSRAGRALARAAGLAPEGSLPPVAARPFTRPSRRRRGPPAVGDGAPRVLLFADTFTNYLDPRVAHAARDVLGAAGYRVAVPRGALCCGRPPFEAGMLERAATDARRVLDALGTDLDDGVPVVVLEPACASFFRDDLLRLLPADPRARRLAAQTLTFAEALERAGFRPPRLARRAVVQPHCHHRAVLGLEADRRLFAALGLDAEVLDGCCGMAGAFGYEHPDVSAAIAERALLPAVRAATPEALVLADGWSCREQVRRATGRRALHLAEVIHIALRAD